MASRAWTWLSVNSCPTLSSGRVSHNTTSKERITVTVGVLHVDIRVTWNMCNAWDCRTACACQWQHCIWELWMKHLPQCSCLFLLPNRQEWPLVRPLTVYQFGLIWCSSLKEQNFKYFSTWHRRHSTGKWRHQW